MADGLPAADRSNRRPLESMKNLPRASSASHFRTAIGINPTRYKVTAFVVGAFFAGVAGALYAHQKSVMQPDGFGFIHSIDFVVMVILGGMGNTAGVIAAAVVLTLMPEFLRQFASYRMILYSLLIIGLMMARPQGLFTVGKKTTANV